MLMQAMYKKQSLREDIFRKEKFRMLLFQHDYNIATANLYQYQPEPDAMCFQLRHYTPCQPHPTLHAQFPSQFNTPKLLSCNVHSLKATLAHWITPWTTQPPHSLRINIERKSLFKAIFNRITENLVVIKPFIVEPCQKIGAVPVSVRCFPVAIRPDDIRLVGVNDFV